MSLRISIHMEQRRQWHPTPVLLPGKSHGWRSLVGCSPWGHEESNTTERLHFHFSLSCIGERNGNPLQCSCLENPRDGGACWAAVSGVTHSWTWLKRLSSSGKWSVNACQFKWREWFDYIAQTFSKCLSSMDCGQDAIVCSSPEEESSHRILINV